MNAAIRDYSCTPAGSNHILHGISPVVSETSSFPYADKNYSDENDSVAPVHSKSRQVSSVIKRFESLGKVWVSITK